MPPYSEELKITTGPSHVNSFTYKLPPPLSTWQMQIFVPLEFPIRSLLPFEFYNYVLKLYSA